MVVHTFSHAGVVPNIICSRLWLALINARVGKKILPKQRGCKASIAPFHEHGRAWYDNAVGKIAFKDANEQEGTSTETYFYLVLF